jgi:hypothetical protein
MQDELGWLQWHCRNKINSHYLSKLDNPIDGNILWTRFIITTIYYSMAMLSTRVRRDIL